MNIRYIYGKYKEKLVMAIAWSLPAYLVYWCAMRMIADSTSEPRSNEIVSKVKAMDVVGDWHIKYKL